MYSASYSSAASGSDINTTTDDTDDNTDERHHYEHSGILKHGHGSHSNNKATKSLSQRRWEMEERPQTHHKQHCVYFICGVLLSALIITAAIYTDLIILNNNNNNNNNNTQHENERIINKNSNHNGIAAMVNTPTTTTNASSNLVVVIDDIIGAYAYDPSAFVAERFLNEIDGIARRQSVGLFSFAYYERVYAKASFDNNNGVYGVYDGQGDIDIDIAAFEDEMALIIEMHAFVANGDGHLSVDERASIQQSLLSSIAGLNPYNPSQPLHQEWKQKLETGMDVGIAMSETQMQQKLQQLLDLYEADAHVVDDGNDEDIVAAADLKKTEFVFCGLICTSADGLHDAERARILEIANALGLGGEQIAHIFDVYETEEMFRAKIEKLLPPPVSAASNSV